MRLRLNTRIVFFFGLLALITLSNYLFLSLAESNADEQQNWVQHTQQVMVISERVMGHLRDAETGQRGFLITRNDNYLEPYNSGVASSKTALETLKTLTLDNPQQQTRLNTIHELMDDKFYELEETIQLTRQGKYDGALKIVQSDLGKNIMDDIRMQFSQFIVEEERLLELRKSAYYKYKVLLRSVFIIEAVVLIFAIAIVYFRLQRVLVQPLMDLRDSIITMTIGEGGLADGSSRQKRDEIGQLTDAFGNLRQAVIERTSQLEKAHTVLEQRVKERTAELSSANEKMLVEIDERKKAEEKLRLAATVFDNTTDGVIITDPQGSIISINNTCLEITGYTEEDLLGENPRIWKSYRHAPPFYKAMWDSLAQEGHWRGEIWNRRKSGEIFPCWQSISAIYEGNPGKVKHYVSIISDISAIRESEKRFEHLAHHDPLTQLPNRLLFNASLDHALKRAHREKCRVGVMFLDLDNFKPINDGLGHPVGDIVLQSVARRLASQVREKDIVARLGGDEFAILMEDTIDPQGVSDVAGKILSSFEVPFQFDGKELHITATIGISLYPEDGRDVTTLIKNADAAMYRAKERGKNRYCFYTMDLTRTALERLQLENDLRLAIKRDELQVYYQPQYSLADGQLVGAEALLRWKHSELGYVSPIKFIPLAESVGLILSIGEYVLRESCTQMKSWLEAGHALGRIGVNVSGQQIQRGNFVQTVRNILDETGLEPQYLELEITESFIMEQANEAITVLEELRNLGVTLAIDDFGTGYSSLNYLKRLPIDKLKIDRSFINDIPHDSNDMAIAKAIIALGKTLQLKVIAEGVETEEQEEFVCIEGCDEVQGYYYSRPIPETEFVEFLANEQYGDLAAFQEGFSK
ncbi:MAG: EAL domain-containing protein [Sedimenticola sp.]